jgi:hypothetical protein
MKQISEHKQTALGEAIGTNQSRISDWSTGKWKPPKVYHLGVRYLLEHDSRFRLDNGKQKDGRPLAKGVIDSEIRIQKNVLCPICRRVMHKTRDAYNHLLLGWVLPVDCTGKGTHARVTRRIDQRGWLWNVANMPPRKKLAPFERRRVTEERDRLQEPLFDNLLACLQRCTPSLDGKKKGCGGVLVYGGRPSSTNQITKRKHVFYCPRKNCDQQWDRRYFSSSGEEVPVGAAGGSRARKSKIPIPKGAELCPHLACRAKLNSPNEVFPGLLRLICPNPKKIPHRLTYYYEKKRSRLLEKFVRSEWVA